MSIKVKSPGFNLVLVNPEIPQNTGNIGRLCVSTGTILHLIKPVGFSLSDRYLKRAGLDYWPHLELNVHDSWQHFLESRNPENMFFFSTKGEKMLWDCPFPEGSYLIFGNESSGLPPDFYNSFIDKMYTIPMPGEFHRSLNLANAAAIVLFEGIRQNIGG